MGERMCCTSVKLTKVDTAVCEFGERFPEGRITRPFLVVPREWWSKAGRPEEVVVTVDDKEGFKP